MIQQCKAQDAVWRAEAAYSCAYDALVRVEALQREVAEMHRLMAEMHAALVAAPDARPAASAARRLG